VAQTAFNALAVTETRNFHSLAGPKTGGPSSDVNSLNEPGTKAQLKLLKIAAQVRVTARRIWVRYSCAYPWQNVFAAAWTALRC
jgi:hypothetical protein